MCVYKCVLRVFREELAMVRKVYVQKALSLSYLLTSIKVIILVVLLCMVLLGSDVSAENIFLVVALYNSVKTSMMYRLKHY